MKHAWAELCQIVTRNYWWKLGTSAVAKITVRNKRESATTSNTGLPQVHNCFGTLSESSTLHLYSKNKFWYVCTYIYLRTIDMYIQYSLQYMSFMQKNNSLVMHREAEIYYIHCDGANQGNESMKGCMEIT